MCHVERKHVAVGVETERHTWISTRLVDRCSINCEIVCTAIVVIACCVEALGRLCWRVYDVELPAAEKQLKKKNLRLESGEARTIHQCRV